MKLNKNQLGRGASALLADERRHSQRVMIRVPITLVATENGQVAKLFARTVEVNTQGAMLVCSRSFESNANVELVNEQTRQRIAARVTRSPRESSEGFLIPVEFTTPAPNFWQITFPPANWKVPEN